MKLIIDTNILFTYFWKESITRHLIIQEDLELYAPEFALEEINKYESHIIKKTGITSKDFEVLRFDLAISIKFISIENYRNMLKKAIEISPDLNDIDFFALALKLNLPIWSNDKSLKNQKDVKILNTDEILKII
jgi:predicted nucleic acid-binding protein